MASMAGCAHRLVVVGAASSSASMELLSSTTTTTAEKATIPTTSSRVSSSGKASSSLTISSLRTGFRGGGKVANDRRRAVFVLASSSASSLCGAQLSISSGGRRRSGVVTTTTRRVVDVRGYQSSSSVVGEDPDWSEDDYVAVGLAHCFRKDDDQKLMDAFVVEPIPAGGLECMDNGGVTCYMHATGTTLGVVLKQDASLLPKEFAKAKFCEDFEFRTKCASRTWKRDHARQNLMNLVPRDGTTVRSDWNFNLQDKRILNQEHVVKDSDNIKQDMSIDVYGRTDKEEEMTAEIGQLYNV